MSMTIEETTRTTLMLGVILQNLTIRDGCKDFIQCNIFGIPPPERVA